MSTYINFTTMEQRNANGLHGKPWPATMKRCKDNLRIPASKYSPRDCVWIPKSERQTRHPEHASLAAERWREQRRRREARRVGLHGLIGVTISSLDGSRFVFSHGSRERIVPMLTREDVADEIRRGLQSAGLLDVTVEARP